MPNGKGGCGLSGLYLHLWCAGLGIVLTCADVRDVAILHVHDGLTILISGAQHYLADLQV